MKSIVSALSPMAGSLPTQNVQKYPTKPEMGRGADEPIVQFAFSLRKSQRRQLAHLAEDRDMTMRAFILDALKERGLDVTEEDMLDLRKCR